MKNKKIDIRSTTILGVRLKGRVAVAGDGQVTLGDMAMKQKAVKVRKFNSCLLYTSPSPRDGLLSRMPSSA